MLDLRTDGNAVSRYGRTGIVMSSEGESSTSGTPSACTDAQQLAFFVQQVPVAMAIYDRDMRCIAASPHYLRDCGLDEYHPIAGTPLEALFPEVGCTIHSLRQRVHAGEELSAEEQPIERGDGMQWVNWVMKPWRRHDGQVGGALHYLDVRTDHVKARADLEASERRFRATFDNASVGVAHVAPDGSWLRVNGRLSEIVGYTPDDLLCATFQDITHPDDLDADLALLDRMKMGEIDRYSIDKRYVRKDGSIVWIELTVGCVRCEDGSLDYLISTVQDISGRKAAEDGLRASERLQRLILDGTLAFVGVMDLEGTMLEANATALHAGGLDRDDVIGRKFWDCYWWSHDPFEMERLEAAVGEAAKGNVVRYDAVVRMAGDTRMTIDFMLSPIPGDDGQVRLLVPSGFDITERKLQEDHVHLLMREVNHRSKNMLAVIQAIARHTAATGVDAFLERFTDRLQSLAAGQDLLIRGDWRAVDIEALLGAQLSHFVDMRGPRITLEGPAIEVNAAASQTLGMALHELATNAVKYGAWSTESGRVAIAWGLDGGDTDTLRFWMQWRESGGPPAVPPRHNGFGSTVIGRMVGANLGCNPVVDYPPEGFSWHLECTAGRVFGDRFAPPAPVVTAPRARNEDAQARRRILIVEDEALIAIELADLIDKEGYEVVGPAASVQAALDQIDLTGCDGAILDVNLGSETSEPVARRLRQLGKPFTVVSGYAREQLPPSMREATLVGKPVSPAALLSEINRVIGDA